MTEQEEAVELLPRFEAARGAWGRPLPGRGALACLALLGTALGGAALRGAAQTAPGGGAGAAARPPSGRAAEAPSSGSGGLPQAQAEAVWAAEGGGPIALAEAQNASEGSWRHTCAHYCGGAFQLARACQCNSGCRKFNDCCADYGEKCHSNSMRGAKSRQPPTPPPPPRHVCHHEKVDRSICEHPRILAHPGASAPKVCMCPPPLVPHKNESCNDCVQPKKPHQMTFYMYRAMGRDNYPMQNVNMASLAGVLWYLHREVVGSTPRKFHIDRIVRFSVTVKVTEDYYNKTPSQFAPFVAFDSGSAMHRSDTWKNFGYVVGCQLVDSRLFNYVPRHWEQPACHPPTSFTCRSPKWYSLPGPCPEERQSDKTPACVQQWPGGACTSAVVTGSPTCTYFAAPAGEISLDELEGIRDYGSFWISTNHTTGDRLPNGNVEYDFRLDAGIGNHFWDGRHSKENCTRRMEAVERLFKVKYPQLPTWLPEPPCS